MATELALERDDRQPIGTFDQVREIIQLIFPEARFGWATSGKEKLRIAAERGVDLPPALRKSLESLPSLLQGQADFGDATVEFGLGYLEPVPCLYVTPRGDSPQLDARLAALEAAVGGTYVISGEETNRLELPRD
jgi:hypothetical protein